MLSTDQADHRGIASTGFCWSCGIPDPVSDPCEACGLSARPKPLARFELVGATAYINQRLKSRSGIVVAETPSSAVLAFADATHIEVPRNKLKGVSKGEYGARCSAWSLVVASRTINPKDQTKFDGLIASVVGKLVSQSIDQARGFALDALDADCPGWLEKIYLTTGERDFLYASYHAGRGSTGAALKHLLLLPEDRYPTKDRIALRCIGAIQADVATHEGVRLQLQPFAERPIAGGLLSLLGGEELDAEEWVRTANSVLSKAAPGEEDRLPRNLVAEFLESLSTGSALPPGTRELGAQVRVFALAHAIRTGASPQEVSLTDLGDMPESLLDDAIDQSAVTISPNEQNHASAKYVLARTKPGVLTQEDLVTLHLEEELARRAFLRSDQKALQEFPKTSVTDQLMVLDRLRSGDVEGAVGDIGAFEGKRREKVQNIADCLSRGSIDSATNEVLTDGTTWPILAPLLPEDSSELSSLGAARPTLRGIAAWRSLSGAVSRLWDWDWEGAAVEAKRCLLVARDEPTRDEALNLIACARWQLGDDADAIAALSSALEDAYTEGLQVNMGVVATSLDPRLAGEHLGKLAINAPTLALRAAAAGRALELWYADPNPWDTDVGEQSLPPELLKALRQLVCSDIDEATFARFARTLSRWDEDWFGDSRQMMSGPFEGSAAARVYQAKARDFEEFIKVLAQIMAQDDPPGWATEECEGLIASALTALDPDDTNPIAASFGLVLIDGGLPMEAEVHVNLVSFTIVAICDGIDPAEGEPKERFLDMVVQARGRLAQMSGEERERSSRLLDFAASRVVGAIAAARAHQYDQVIDLYNDIASHLRGVPRRQINMSAVRDGTQPAVDFLVETSQLLDRLITQELEQDLKRQLEEFRKEMRTLLTAFSRLRGP
ncbi:MAG: hypothetical protein WD556_07695 [Actinomycetota bacterium]